MVQYYDRVVRLDPHAQDLSRFFPVPSLAHYAGGSGGQPTATRDALLAWVGNGTAPNSLLIKFTDPEGQEQTRIACPYPERPVWKEGESGKHGNVLDSWQCEEQA
ncbi:hypothetical protein ACJZ2D_013596 [Fusarium nematophilum]